MCRFCLSGVDLGIAVDSVISDRKLAHKLAVCPFFEHVRYSSLDAFRLWNLCRLDFGLCGSCGRRYKFKPRFVGLYVIWVCPKLCPKPVVPKVHPSELVRDYF